MIKETNFGYMPKKAVTLITGEIICLSDPEGREKYREECEAKRLLGLPLSQRRQYLEKLNPVRRDSLKEMIRLVFDKEKKIR